MKFDADISMLIAKELKQCQDRISAITGYPVSVVLSAPSVMDEVAKPQHIGYNDYLTLLYAAVQAVTGILPEEIRSTARHRPVTTARKLMCLILRESPYRPSTMRIGRAINRDHSTVMAALRTIHDEIELYSDTRDTYLNILSKLNQFINQ